MTQSITYTGDNAFAIWGFMGRVDLIDNLELKNTDQPVIQTAAGNVTMKAGDALSKGEGGAWSVTRTVQVTPLSDLDQYWADMRARRITMGVVCIYAAIYPDLRVVAHEMGYALAMHGSMVRDFDLIAVPWTVDAKSADELAEALQKLLGGWVAPESGKIHTWSDGFKKSEKPHGRLSYTLRFGGEELLNIDLSVMPRMLPVDAGTA